MLDVEPSMLSSGGKSWLRSITPGCASVTVSTRLTLKSHCCLPSMVTVRVFRSWLSCSLKGCNVPLMVTTRGEPKMGGAAGQTLAKAPGSAPRAAMLTSVCLHVRCIAILLCESADVFRRLGVKKECTTVGGAFSHPLP